MCMCVFGQPARSDVAMEEVCCRFVRCSRRTSSLTLTLPRSKLVRPENWRFGFLLEQRRHQMDFSKSPGNGYEAEVLRLNPFRSCVL